MSTVKKASDLPTIQQPSSLLGLDAGGAAGKVRTTDFLRKSPAVSDINDAWGAAGFYTVQAGCLNYPEGVTPNVSDTVMCLTNGNFGIQLLFSMNGPVRVFIRRKLGNEWDVFREIKTVALT